MSADGYLADLLVFGQAGRLTLAHEQRGAGVPLPAWWLESHTLPSGQPAKVLSLEGRAQLARVADWTQHGRTWGARLIRSWLAPWHEHRRMHAYGRLYPYPWYTDPPPSQPPVHTWADEAARALWLAKLDHATALEAETARWGDRLDPRVRWSLLLAPLGYVEGLGRWTELARDGAFDRTA